MYLCGEKFSKQHIMSCKKRAFVTFRHNKLRYITEALLNEVCHDVTTEPMLTHVAYKNILPSSSNTNNEARLYIRASSF